MRVEDGLHDKDDDGLLEPWHMFARRWDFRCSSAVLLALQEDVARVSYPAFIPHRGCGSWVRSLRLRTAAEQQQQFFDTDSGTRSVFGQWALRVNAASKYEDSVNIVRDSPLFPSPPVRQPLPACGNTSYYVAYQVFSMWIDFGYVLAVFIVRLVRRGGLCFLIYYITDPRGRERTKCSRLLLVFKVRSEASVLVQLVVSA